MASFGDYGSVHKGFKKTFDSIMPNLARDGCSARRITIWRSTSARSATWNGPVCAPWLFRLFSHVLRALSTCVVLSLSAVDLMAEILLRGLNKAKQLGEQILDLLRFAASWAGIKIGEATDFTASIIRWTLAKMLTSLRTLSTQALAFTSRNIWPISLALGGAFVLTASSAF